MSDSHKNEAFSVQEPTKYSSPMDAPFTSEHSNEKSCFNRSTQYPSREQCKETSSLGLERSKSDVSNGQGAPSSQTKTRGQRFEPIDLQKDLISIDSGLPSELWAIVQSAPATFPPTYFLDVSKNLLKNPNLTSSHLFRAEIFYDSQTDATFNPAALVPEELSKFVKHMKVEYRPQIIAGGYHDYELQWTIVRKLIPRNPQLDKPIVQTCHLFTSQSSLPMPYWDDCGLSAVGEEKSKVLRERHLVIYIPHEESPDGIPWYHPPVRALAILYTWLPETPSSSPSGNLALYYNLYPGTEINHRMGRTALNMLKVIHKHSQGRVEGYKKRVHHDVLIPQKTFQDTYTFLKGKYAKNLIDNWVEQTLPEKHVFEDLGIAAFLIELWTDMYGDRQAMKDTGTLAENEEDESTLHLKIRANAQKRFPGFVDMGCGNGVLVYILLKEGWNGWGFDARYRKTWTTFPADVRQKLKEMILIPQIFQSRDVPSTAPNDSPTPTQAHPTISPEKNANEERENPTNASLSTSNISTETSIRDCQTSPTSPSTGSHELSYGLFASDTPNGEVAPRSDRRINPASSTCPPNIHGGIFPPSTFLIANHADELTLWTPLLACLSQSAFIAIPCCSHNFAGARFRAPNKELARKLKPTKIQQQHAILDRDTTHQAGYPLSQTLRSEFSASEISVSSNSDQDMGSQADGSSESKHEKTGTKHRREKHERPQSGSIEAESYQLSHDIANMTMLGDNASTTALAPSPRRLNSIASHSDGVPGNLSLATAVDTNVGPRNRPIDNVSAVVSCGDPSDPTASPMANSKRSKPGKPPSAFASLCTYLAYICAEIGFLPEKEMLRIPSTRNTAFVGRKFESWVETAAIEEKVRRVRDLVEREIGLCVEDVGREWTERSLGLRKKTGDH